MRSKEGIGATAALPSLVGGFLLGAVVYLVERDLAGAMLVGGSATIILFLVIGFPTQANRRISGGVRSRTARVRQAALTLFAFAVGVFALGVALDSLALMLVSLSSSVFWLALLAWAKR